MAGVKKRLSCRELLEKCNIFPHASEYPVSLLLFIAENMETFQTNTEIHSINMRHTHDLHIPNTTFTRYQKDVIIQEPSYSMFWYINVS
jgi:hypothetical protein